jgi:hypothetical protein
MKGSSYNTKKSSAGVQKPPPPRSVPSIQAPSSTMHFPSLGRTVMEGFAFGTGSSIARNAVNQAMGGMGITIPSPAQNEAKQQSSCETYKQLLSQCFENNQSDCREIFEKMSEVCFLSKK